MEDTKLSISQRVNKILMDCLFKEEEVVGGKTPEVAIIAKGITRNFGFHPDRLKGYRQEITELLNLMPQEFHFKDSGGWSFLQLCMDKDGNQWGEHSSMEELVCLGIAIGMVKFTLPREMWKSFPGGMPYLVINTEAP